MSTFELIRTETASSKLSVNRLCRLLQVSRSGYYDYLGRKQASPPERESRLVALIRAAHAECHGAYGVRRMHRELLDAGERVSRKLVRQLMKKNGIRSVHTPKFVKTTNSDHTLGYSPNLLNQCFDVDAPDRVWVADITYVWTAEGWCYLAVLIDLYSRRVVGWALDDNLRTDLPLRALQRALESRSPSPGLIHHSDRGAQYAAKAYRKVLAKWKASSSMSDAGNCYDNAVAESFFATLKKERLHHLVSGSEKLKGVSAVAHPASGIAGPYAA